ncbi:MAG: glycosyltransferase [Actinomycetota bacterium]
MRIVQWHGWLLEGSGSNVYTARVTEAFRRRGHDVVLLCQERHVERYDFFDAWGTVSASGVSALTPTGAPSGPGKAVLLRPDIGHVLPVFVVDEYEGFEVKRFVDLSDRELEAYVEANVAALRAAIAWHGADAVITGHAVPGSVIARRALGPGRYVAKVHGSDLEYAVRIDPRCRELAREGLVDATAVVGASRDVLRRAFELVPEASERLGRVVPPGVDERFRPMPRPAALRSAPDALDDDPDTARGRREETTARLRDAIAHRDADAIDALVVSYDQEAPDPGTAAALRSLAGSTRPLVAYFGKLIPQKGVHLFLQALARSSPDIDALVMGFGGSREWLQALVLALGDGDAEAARWIAERTGFSIELDDAGIAAARGLGDRVRFTGRLDHRYAPGALAAAEVLVVPSILDEAFGMVAVEGAAAGALPLVARHSGLAEIAAELERSLGVPEAFSFLPGPGAVERIAEGIDRLIRLPERDEARAAVHRLAATRWSWEQTADSLLRAAGP